MIQGDNQSVVAVVVTFNPEHGVLKQLLGALVPQVAFVVVVDNGSAASPADCLSDIDTHVIEVLCLGENRGIAFAQNEGIQRARDREAAFVLLMDQDSIPAPDMVEKLMAALEQHPQAAAAGPRYVDERHANPPPFIRVRGLRLVRCECVTEDTVVPVDYLIASGCLIPMPVLNEVGGMRDQLFIDFVDIEWGLRAHHLGFQSYGVCAAHMQHSLGDSPIELFGTSFPLHSPLRHYYHFRNAVYLNGVSWVPLNWKLANSLRMFLKYVFYSLFAKPRMAHWHMMTLGVWHGLLGRAGRYE